MLEDTNQPVIKDFLAERDLELSLEKTVITHIEDGFTFLGQTFRKHGRLLHMTPSTAENYKDIFEEVKSRALPPESEKAY